MKISFLSISTSERRDTILCSGISKILMLLAMPLLMMGLVQSMIPLSDGLFINNIMGPHVANVVTYCVPILNIVIALSQGLGLAGMAVTSQVNGRGDFAQGKKISSQLILLTFLFGIASIPVMTLLIPPISAIVTKEISDIVWLCLVLDAFAVPLYFMEMVYNTVKNAAGRPGATFVRILLLLLLRILFNLPFIYLIPLGITGCVISSILSNVIVCVIMFYGLFVREPEKKLKWPGVHLDREITMDPLRAGLPTMLSSVMVSLGLYLINNEVQRCGMIALNGQGIASNITSICFAMTGASDPATTTVVGMNMGTGKKDRAHRSMWITCGFNALTIMALVVPIVPFVGPLIGLFTRNQEVLDVACTSLYICIYSTINLDVYTMQQGAFIGLGRTRIPLVISILRIWFLYYLFILTTEGYFGVLSVFQGSLFLNPVAALIIALMILRIPWESVLSNRALMSQGEGE